MIVAGDMICFVVGNKLGSAGVNSLVKGVCEADYNPPKSQTMSPKMWKSCILISDKITLSG